MRFATAYFTVAVFVALVVIANASSSESISSDREGNEEEEVPRETSTTTTTTTAAATVLTEDNFTEFLQAHDMAFVNLAAPSWSVWCQRLAPVWEEFALEVKQQNIPVVIGKVDCTAQANLCRNQKIVSYPTMRWFEHGNPVMPDYKMDRRVDALVAFAKRKLELSKQYAETNDKEEKEPDFSNQPEEKPSHGTNVKDKCTSMGFPYGGSNQRFSQSGGDEFDEFSERQIKIAPACDSRKTNPRGEYNSFFGPCKFLFHQVPTTSSMRESSLGGSLQLSTACSGKNVVKDPNALQKRMGPLFDYVRKWPDECVGDFGRCYSVSKEADARIFMKHFCLQKWDIPESVTHISVNCTADKIESQNNKQAAVGGVHSKFMEQREKHHREKVAIFLTVAALACCCCWVILCIGYKLIAVPYLKSIKRSKSDPDLQSLTADTADWSSDKVSTSDNDDALKLPVY